MFCQVPCAPSNVLKFYLFTHIFAVDTGLVYKVVMATVSSPASGNLGTLEPVVVDEIQVSMCVRECVQLIILLGENLPE